MPDLQCSAVPGFPLHNLSRSLQSMGFKVWQDAQQTILKTSLRKLQTNDHIAVLFSDDLVTKWSMTKSNDPAWKRRKIQPNNPARFAVLTGEKIIYPERGMFEPFRVATQQEDGVHYFGWKGNQEFFHLSRSRRTQIYLLGNLEILRLNASLPLPRELSITKYTLPIRSASPGLEGLHCPQIWTRHHLNPRSSIPESL